MVALDKNLTELTLNNIYLQIACLIKLTVQKLFQEKKAPKRLRMLNLYILAN
jgi:hypothetical protein